jgi:hypothetical protein
MVSDGFGGQRQTRWRIRRIERKEVREILEPQHQHDRHQQDHVIPVLAPEKKRGTKQQGMSWNCSMGVSTLRQRKPAR